MDEETKKRVERILTRGAKAAVRLAYESAIAAAEDLEEKNRQWAPAGYMMALADVKIELVKLHSHFAE